MPLSLLNHSALALFAQRTRIPTSSRSIGFCAIWVCISSSSSSQSGGDCALGGLYYSIVLQFRVVCAVCWLYRYSNYLYYLYQIRLYWNILPQCKGRQGQKAHSQRLFIFAHVECACAFKKALSGVFLPIKSAGSECPLCFTFQVHEAFLRAIFLSRVIRRQRSALYTLSSLRP